MNREKKIDYLIVPISLGVIIIVTIILVICSLNWKYYLIGGMLGLLTHGLMVKQNLRMARFSQIDPEHKVYNPKKSSLLWLLARMLVTFGVFFVLIYMSIDKNGKNVAIIDTLIALGGYLTSKVIFIILLLIFREKVLKE
ncbi:MAG: hypothetical protein ACI35S_05725 [Anaeroplasma sp.]